MLFIVRPEVGCMQCKVRCAVYHYISVHCVCGTKITPLSHFVIWKWYISFVSISNRSQIKFQGVQSRIHKSYFPIARTANYTNLVLLTYLDNVNLYSSNKTQFRLWARVLGSWARNHRSESCSSHYILLSSSSSSLYVWKELIINLCVLDLSYMFWKFHIVAMFVIVDL
jgi:hypothetical protein